MSRIQELQAQLQDTQAAIAGMENALARDPACTALALNAQALRKRKRDLEEDLRREAPAAPAKCFSGI